MFKLSSLSKNSYKSIIKNPKILLVIPVLAIVTIAFVFILLILQTSTSSGIKNSKNRTTTTQSQLQGIYMPVSYNPVDSSNFERKLKLLDNPLADGMSMIVLWQDIEPSRGKYDFKGLDEAIGQITAKNKKVAIRFLTGGPAAPNYVINNPKVTKITDNSIAPWDMQMLNDWARVVAVVGKHYAGKSWLQRVGISGPTMQWMEVVPTRLDSEEFALWKEKGYTTEKLISAWHYIIGEYNKAFPKDYLSIAFKPIVPSTADPKNPAGDFEPARQIAEDAYSQLGSRFVFQTSNFSDIYPRLGKSNTPADQVYLYMKQISGRNPTGVLLGEQNMSIKYPEKGTQDAYRAAICNVKDLKIQYLETAAFRLRDKSLQDDFSSVRDNILGKSESSLCSTAPSPSPSAKSAAK